MEFLTVSSRLFKLGLWLPIFELKPRSRLCSLWNFSISLFLERNPLDSPRLQENSTNWLPGSGWKMKHEISPAPEFSELFVELVSIFLSMDKTVFRKTLATLYLLRHVTWSTFVSNSWTRRCSASVATLPPL